MSETSIDRVAHSPSTVNQLAKPEFFEDGPQPRRLSHTFQTKASMASTSQQPGLQVCLVALGCPKNLVDAERMLADLAEAGCVVGAPMEVADVIVVHTCGFLAAARNEAREVLGEAMEQKATGPARRVVVTGCWPSYLRWRGEGLDELGSADAVVSAADRGRIVEAVLGEDRAEFLEDSSAPYLAGGRGDAGRFRLTLPHTAYLRLAEGCSRACSFCTIPAIRGPFRSKPASMVLDEARELLADGAVELNLIAQDTTAWGRDLDPPGSLAGLLRQLDGLDGPGWLRLMYTYPQGFDEDLLGAMADGAHLARYVDMPLQHIATPILRAMRRGVDREATEAVLDRLAKAVPDIAIRTSFIVGFPGETEAMFEELRAFVRQGRFEAVGVFEYSPEPGTPAAEFDGAVPDEVATDRAERLMAAQREVVEQRNAQRQGRELDVLVDGFDERGVCLGRFEGQAPDIDAVCLLTEPRQPGSFVRGRVVGSEGFDLIVEPTEATGQD